MEKDSLEKTYSEYIACLNRRDWENLGNFVHKKVVRNDRQIGLTGYRAMLEGDVIAIPDLFFSVKLLVCQTPLVASRLHFDCTPTGDLFGHPIRGRRVLFDENVFYEFSEHKIARVWSVIDQSAIAAQI